MVLQPKRLFVSLLLAATLVSVCPMALAFANAEVNAYIQAAKGYMEAKQWDYAGYEWRKALEKDPDNLEAITGLADMLIQSGQTLEAVRHLEAARKKKRKLSLELAYGHALTEHKDHVRAAKVYRRILAQHPLEANTFKTLVALLPKLPVQEKKIQKAFVAKAAREASEKSKGALKDGNYKQAGKYLAISSAYNPSPTDLNNYGILLLLYGNYDEADAQFKKLTKTDATQWEYYANSALTALGKGNYFEAATYMEKAISLCADPAKKPLLYNNLGFIYENQNKLQKAQSAYEQAISLQPGFVKAQFNLAYVCQKAMLYDDAIQVYQTMLKKDPKNATILNRLGFVYELAHEERKAMATYKRATKVAPSDKLALRNQAFLYNKMGEQKEANEAYKQMMAIEFREIENKGKEKAKVTNKNGSPYKLLDYADVFFVEPG